MPEKVLIITYYWPPSGGAGVQRWLKFAKYLPASGWMPVILTVRPEYAAYPVTDETLADDIPMDIVVHKTKATNYFSLYNKDKSKIPAGGFAGPVNKSLKERISRFIRGNFFIPDPRKGWNRYAIRKACELIRKENISHIITTSPPHSTQLIGLKLKKRFPQIKWLADFRDPWTDIYYYDMFSPTWLARRIDSNMEKHVIARADKITTVGHSLSKLLSSKVDSSGEKIDTLPNGYDEEDFEGLVPTVPEIFTITYTGTLSEAYPIQGLFNAIKGVTINSRPVKLRFVGTVAEQVKGMTDLSGDQFISEFIPYCEHQVAIRYMMAASMLIIIIPDHPSSSSIITGKLFEYIATGKPVLLLGPTKGDAANILTRCGHKGVFDYDDFNGIRNFIINTSMDNALNRPGQHHEYSRRNIANSLGSLLRTISV